MSDVHKNWLQDSMDDVSRGKIEKIDSELAMLKAEYKAVRASHDKTHPQARAILKAAAKLRRDRASVLRVADMIKGAFGG